MKTTIRTIRVLLLAIILGMIVGIGYSCIYPKIRIHDEKKDMQLADKNKKIVVPEVYVDVEDVAVQLAQLADKNEKVVIPKELHSSFLRATSTELRKDQFICEKDGEKWLSLLNFSGKDVPWVVLQNDKKKNAIYNLLETKKGNIFLKYYDLEFKGTNAEIYKLKDKKDMSVMVCENKLWWRYDRFIIKGINSYNLAYQTRQEMEGTFENLSNAGINTIRFWAFRDGDKNGIQTDAGVMNKDRLQNLDFVMVMADKYDMHLIPVLINNWDDFGGKKQYLKWSKLNIRKKDLFFTEAKPKKLFMSYIDHIVPRQNSITGEYYRDDISILAWEIMNEPRIAPDKILTLNAWVEEVGSYIKQKDANHLVYIGSETEVEGGDKRKAKELCAIGVMDICSTHIYLYNGKKLLYDDLAQLSAFIIQQKEFATKNGKPLIIGEFGISEKDRPYNKPPVETIKDITQIILGGDLDGYLIWDWDPLYYYDPLSFTMDKKRIYNFNKLQEIINADRDH